MRIPRKNLLKTTLLEDLVERDRMAKEMHKEIVELKHQVLEMATLAASMLNDSIKALLNQDLELAKQVDKQKHPLRNYDDNIEERTLKLLTLHQPMAKDMRRIATILKVITYLTRIGRYGKDIAKVTLELKTAGSPNRLVNLQHMQEHVDLMISRAIEAFDKADVSFVEDFGERDDEVDQLRWSIFRECITYMMEDAKCITPCAHYIMVARYLERCGDHACKIAEKVHYMVTGQHVEIS